MALAYLLDTNILSEGMRPRPSSRVLNRLLGVGDGAATAAPVWHELQFGWLRLPRGKRRDSIGAMLEAMARVIVVLPYDAAAASWHARERSRLAKRGKTSPFVDGQIAAIAAVNHLTLVTRNAEDFAGYRALSVENWFEDD